MWRPQSSPIHINTTTLLCRSATHPISATLKCWFLSVLHHNPHSGPTCRQTQNSGQHIMALILWVKCWQDLQITIFNDYLKKRLSAPVICFPRKKAWHPEGKIFSWGKCESGQDSNCNSCIYNLVMDCTWFHCATCSIMFWNLTCVWSSVSRQQLDLCAKWTEEGPRSMNCFGKRDDVSLYSSFEGWHADRSLLQKWWQVHQISSGN